MTVSQSGFSLVPPMPLPKTSAMSNSGTNDTMAYG